MMGCTSSMSQKKRIRKPLQLFWETLVENGVRLWKIVIKIDLRQMSCEDGT